MHSAAIIFLIMSLVVVPLVAKRTGGIGPRMPYAVLPQPQPIQQPVAAKNEIIARLDALLQDSVLNDEWYTAVNDLIVDLVSLDKPLSIEYLKKIQAKTANNAVKDTIVAPPTPAQMPVPTPVSVPVPELTKDEIMAQLDEKLRSTKNDDVWQEQVNNLIFDLAMLDRNASQEYLKKMQAQMVPVITQPSVPLSPAPVEPSLPVVSGEKKEIFAPAVPTESMKKGTPPPPPLLRPSSDKVTQEVQGFGGQAAGPMKKGAPPAPPAPLAGGMKKGTPPPPPAAGAKKGGTPPPPPGPMVKGKKGSAAKEKASPAAPGAKVPEPLSITVSYGGPQLAKRSNEEIIELFTQLLDALATRGDFWNEITKEPMPQWRNRVDTAKRALSDPKRNLAIDGARMIEDRIKQVRAEKAQLGLQKQESAEKEKPKEEMPEYTEKELIDQIKYLKKPQNEDPSAFTWLIDFQGAIKKLDKINHEKAVEYETEFITKFPGQRRFLPKKKEKEAVIIKELTEEEKLIATIDTILDKKPALWAIKVREPIQVLYDMNPAKGLEYQEKYIAATKQATGKADKPFLKLKE